MTAGKRGLGRGLDALLQGFQGDLEAPEVSLVPVSDISPNPNQPRRDFDPQALEELSESIKANGVLQPVLVRPLKKGEGTVYELVAGERRWRASRLAALEDIPVIIKDLDDDESLAIALIENLQREDLNAIEEAAGYKRLQEEFSLTQDVLSKRVGKSRPAIANALRLLHLPSEVQDDIRGGSISAGHGRALLAIGDDSAREELRSRIKDLGLSVREAEAQVTYWKKTDALPGAEDVARPAKRGQARSRPQMSNELKDIAKAVGEALGMNVAMSGTRDNGKLLIRFVQPDQLEDLLARFGLGPDGAAKAEDADVPTSVDDVFGEDDQGEALELGDVQSPDMDLVGIDENTTDDDSEIGETPDLSQDGPEDEDDELAQLDKALDEIL